MRLGGCEVAQQKQDIGNEKCGKLEPEAGSVCWSTRQELQQLRLSASRLRERDEILMQFRHALTLSAPSNSDWLSRARLEARFSAERVAARTNDSSCKQAPGNAAAELLRGGSRNHTEGVRDIGSAVVHEPLYTGPHVSHRNEAVETVHKAEKANHSAVRV